MPAPPRTPSWEEVVWLLDPRANEVANEADQPNDGRFRERNIQNLYRALFALRQTAPTALDAVQLLIRSLDDRAESFSSVRACALPRRAAPCMRA